MKRWTIHLPPLLCGLSLLIFLLAMGIWVRSYFFEYSVAREVAGSDVQGNPSLTAEEIYCVRSHLCYFRVTKWSPVPPKPETVPWHVEITPIQSSYSSAIAWYWGGFYHARSNYMVVLPLWLFLLFAIPPVLWVRRWRRKRGRGFPVEMKQAAEATT